MNVLQRYQDLDVAHCDLRLNRIWNHYEFLPQVRPAYYYYPLPTTH